MPVVGHALSVPRRLQDPKGLKPFTSIWFGSARYTNNSREIITRPPATEGRGWAPSLAVLPATAAATCAARSPPFSKASSSWVRVPRSPGLQPTTPAEAQAMACARPKRLDECLQVLLGTGSEGCRAVHDLAVVERLPPRVQQCAHIPMGQAFHMLY